MWGKLHFAATGSQLLFFVSSVEATQNKGGLAYYLAAISGVTDCSFFLEGPICLVPALPSKHQNGLELVNPLWKGAPWHGHGFNRHLQYPGRDGMDGTGNCRTYITCSSPTAHIAVKNN